MAQAVKPLPRVFKTAWFAKAAKKANIDDSELCACIEKAVLGQGDDLGGGVFKIRMNRNMHRAILLAKAGHWWVFEYLFAKKCSREYRGGRTPPISRTRQGVCEAGREASPTIN